MTVQEAAAALVAAGREVVDLGLSPGTSGNLSVRCDDVVVVTPTGVALGALETDRLSVVDLDGRHVDGPAPTKEVPLHLAMYRRDTTTAAIVHVHSAHAVAASCLPSWAPYTHLPPVTPYLVMRVGRVPLLPYARPGSAVLADHIAAEELPFRAAFLANHGIIAAGPDVATAIDRTVEIEETARTVLALQGHAPRLLTPDQVAELVEAYGAPWPTAP